MPHLFALLILLTASLNAVAENHQTGVITERQAAFKDIKESMKVIKENLKSEDTQALISAATIILERANKVTTLFPDGSFEGDTRAKEKIWEQQDDFSARQQDLIAHAEALVTATRGGDPKALKEAFKITSKDCKGCHMRYRQIF